MSRDRPTVLVLAGGSAGTHVLTAELGGRPDVEVRVLTSRPDQWGGPVQLTEELSRSRLQIWRGAPAERVTRGAPAAVFGWDHAATALQDADAVFLIGPVGAHRSMLARLVPALTAGQDLALGSLFAQGGFDWEVRAQLAQRPELAARLTVFGLKRYPYICRTEDYGRSVRLLRRFPLVPVAVNGPTPAAEHRLLTLLQTVFDKPLRRLPSMAACTVNMSNQLLHPAMLWGLFHDYVPGETVYPERRLLYGECNTVSVRSMEAVYTDLYPLTEALGELLGLPLTGCLGVDPWMGAFVRPRALFLHRFGIHGIGPLHWLEELFGSAAFRNQQGFSVLHAPMTEVPGGFVPDFSSRIFTDDLAHGLCVLYGLGLALGQPVPRIGEQIRRLQGLMGKRYLDGEAPGPDFADTGAPQHYGVHDRSALAELVRG